MADMTRQQLVNWKRRNRVSRKEVHVAINAANLAEIPADLAEKCREFAKVSGAKKFIAFERSARAWEFTLSSIGDSFKLQSNSDSGFVGVTEENKITIVIYV